MRDVTGADLGNESEVAREGRGGLVVSKGIIPVTHEGGSVSRKSPRLSQDKTSGQGWEVKEPQGREELSSAGMATSSASKDVTHHATPQEASSHETCSHRKRPRDPG